MNMVVFVFIMIKTPWKHVSWIVPKRLAALLLDFTTEVGVTFSSILRQLHPLAQMGTSHTLDLLPANRMPELLTRTIQMLSARSKYNPQISQEGHACHRVNMNWQNAVPQDILRLIQKQTAKALWNISAAVMNSGEVREIGRAVLRDAFVILQTMLSITTLQMSLEAL